MLSLDQASRPAHAIERTAHRIVANTRTDRLVALVKTNREAHVTDTGRIFATTGRFTGRSAKDKFIVDDATTHDTVWWDNTGRIERHAFDALMADMIAATTGRDLHRQQLFAGADPRFRLGVDVFTPSAWHALFIRHLLIRPTEDELARFEGNVTILHLPEFEADPARHGTLTSTAIALDLTRNIVLICGTAYAGEIKKSVFSLFNFHAPEQGVLPMHCSANIGTAGDTTLFFGLSGTGKTTLSAAPDRALIGDDEHGWSDRGVFNLEGGCYAKAINLDAEREPEIHGAAAQFGSIHENVAFDPATGQHDYDDASLTENTRIAYPLTAIANRVDEGLGAAPRNIVFLSADAFGVLPPIARLNAEQAIFYFLSGYTAKLAGTERGVTEPQATFSACFGAPFMARHPTEYGRLLADRIQKSGATIWLLNTGWTGGAYGTGKRIALMTTRRMLNAALGGELDNVDYRRDDIFGLDVPVAVEGVDPALLNPALTWPDRAAYARAAERLVAMFDANFDKLAPHVGPLAAAGSAKAMGA